ncbi:hypothetical protein [Klebsiella aerogenes]|uniref:Uncharacterized protein n=1 Tax=Klebsiella aerogenes TaxID=548 RepID=A0AAP9R1L5_KLEAE|nr:hypothetical protein [Klebsiella aerogenes]QMR42902.1 hypothetical protein HV331_25645 [Klebsiella aerogenes]
MNTTNATVSSSQQCGKLAQEAGFDLPLQPLHSQRGWYIGTFSDDNSVFGPVSRESVEYFSSAELATQALQDGTWTQRCGL